MQILVSMATRNKNVSIVNAFKRIKKKKLTFTKTEMKHCDQFAAKL